MSTIGLPEHFSFEVSAVLGEALVPVATIRGRRQRLRAVPSRTSPILVTTLGRTGSTLVMKLLSLHPDIAAYPLYRTEPKVASYWGEVMLALTDPRSYLQPVTSTIRGPNWWLGEQRPFDEAFDDPELMRWLGNDQVAETATFCRERIVAFYDRLAAEEEHPAYFAEKCVPRDPSYADILREMFPDMREIVLVRDFRDMLCSIFAYNERLGSQLFGRELADSDEAYIRGNLAAQVHLLARGWKQRSDSAFLLKYEDLIVNPAATIASLLDYLELDATEPVIDSLTAEVGTGSATHGTSGSPRDSIGRWRSDLDPELAVLCEEVLASAMETFGYARSESPAPANAPS